MGSSRSRWMGAVGLAAMTIALSTPAVFAVAPEGACCIAGGGCEDVTLMQCDTLDGSYIGDGTACQEIDCGAPVAAPMLSIAGLIAALGALGGLGVYRLTIGRRPPRE
jgi:hypothetical protein